METWIYLVAAVLWAMKVCKGDLYTMKKSMMIVFALVLVVAAAWSVAGCSGQAAGSGNAADAGYRSLFEEEEIMEISVEITEEDWADILANPMDEVYHEATVAVNGETLEQVGIRTKGNSSLASVANSDSDRYGFRIKADKYVDDQTFSGLNEFVLNSQFADPSYMREYLTYAAMEHLGGITPYVNFAEVYVNGEHFGFYLCVEAIDDSFVERQVDAETAELYKADGERSTLLPSMQLTQFESKYGSDTSLTHISELIEVLDAATAESKAELEAILDVDSILKAIAINAVMGNYDSYSGSMAHNYYLLYDNGIFRYVGWDYNMSIGGFMGDNGSSVTADINDPFYGTTAADRPLFRKLLDIEEYKSRYLGYVEELLTYFEGFESTVQELDALIGEHVQNDPSAFYTYEQYQANITASDTDLSTQAKGGFGGGEAPADGERPEMPEGMTMPEDGNFTPPEGMTMPEDGDFTPPEGMMAPQDGDFTPPEGMGAPSGDGEADAADGDADQGGGRRMDGGGMINSIPPSIVDYITQRVENIKTQLTS